MTADRAPGTRTARFVQHELLDGPHETRFAEACFADDQHHLSHAVLRLFPAIREQADFGIAPGQRRERRRKATPVFGIDVRAPERVKVGNLG